VGGGYIALELGQMLHRFCTDVTILERSQQLLTHRYEPEVGQAIGQVFSEDGIRVVTKTAVSSARQEGQDVVATTSVGGAQREYRAERLLVATGRRPNTGNFAIEKSGVAVNQHGEAIVDEYLRTNVSHVFAAGDVVGRESDGDARRKPRWRNRCEIRLFRREMRAVDRRVIPRYVSLILKLASA
jgi:mercuric reductase